MAAHDDDRHIGVVLVDDAQDIEAVQLAALEPDVQEHQAGLTLLDVGQRGIAVAGFAGLESLVFQDPGSQSPDIGFRHQR